VKLPVRGDGAVGAHRVRQVPIDDGGQASCWHNQQARACAVDLHLLPCDACTKTDNDALFGKELGVVAIRAAIIALLNRAHTRCKFMQAINWEPFR
jgi:hypothetical protein